MVSDKNIYLTLQILEGHEYKPFAYYSRSVLRINVTDMANYTCYAINQMIGGRQSVDQESFMVYVQSEGKVLFLNRTWRSYDFCHSLTYYHF